MGKTKLKNLLIDRVDLVTSGDNPEANIMLFKRKGDEGLEEKSMVDSIVAGVKEVLKTLVPNNDKKGEPTMDFEKMLESIEDATLRQQLLDEYNKAKQAGEAELTKAREEATAAAKVEHQKELDALTETHKQEVAKMQKSTEELEEEEFMKSLPESVRKRLLKAEERVAEAEKVAKQEQEARELEGFVAKAKTFKGIAAKPEELGSDLMKLSKADKEAYERLEGCLKAASEAIVAGGIFKEVGGNGEGTGDAWSQIEKLADEIVKEGKLTKEQAITEVMEKRTDLYKQYREELEVE